MTAPKKVFICSPYRGTPYEMCRNTHNAQSYCRRAMLQDTVLPIAPHLYFTQFLKDSNPDERQLGIEVGIALLHECEEMWVFGTPTEGMRLEIAAAEQAGIPVRRFTPDATPTTNQEDTNA